MAADPVPRGTEHEQAHARPAPAVCRQPEPAGHLAARPPTEPHPERLAAGHPRRDEILAAHAAALESGQAAYADPHTGLSVLTSRFLADRRVCCTKGCR